MAFAKPRYETPGKEGAPTVAHDSSYVLAHLSDPHLSSLESVKLHQLLSKRVLGYLSWKLHRRAEHRREVLDAMVRDLSVTRPDHIVITGDLTHLGLPSEFRQVSHWLQSVERPTRLTLVPGNHDAYVRAPYHRTLKLLAPYLISDPLTVSQDQDAKSSMFPSLRIRGPLALISLSSAYPSPPFFATGRIGKSQLRALEGLLDELGRDELIRVVLVHHPPVANTVRWRKRLIDSRDLTALLLHRGVELVLHGHAHRSSWKTLQTRHGKVPVIGVPSASGIGLKPEYRAQYHLYRFQRQGAGWALRISVRGFDINKQAFVHEREHTLTLPWSRSARPPSRSA